MMIRLATFNLFWFPTSAVAKNTRGEEEFVQIASVLARLDADVIVFQEMLDRAALRRLLALVPGRSYDVVDPLEEGSHKMRVMLAWDRAPLELVASEVIPSKDINVALRNAVAVRLRAKATDQPAFWVVGAHFPSGLPGLGSGSADDPRITACDDIGTWLVELQEQSPDPAPVFVLGDFNLVAGHECFEPWKGAASLRGVPESALLQLPERGEIPAPEGEQWSTIRDAVIIDHVFVNRAADAWLRSDALVYAYDLDPSLSEPRGANGAPFFRTVEGANVRLIPWQGAGEQLVRRMYNVSDHRPVRVEIEVP